MSRQVLAGVRALLVLTVLLGIAYPLAMTGLAQVVFPARADGSLVTRGHTAVGSSLVGQSFTVGKHARPDPAYFQSRPSVAGDGYDPLATSASNLSPDNPGLVRTVRERQRAVAAADRVPVSQVPPDAVTASGSGLDPHISPAYAALQVPRVAAARRVSQAAVRRLVEQSTAHRTFGFLGEDRVDVLLLNLALDRQLPGARGAH